jgi:hypothetical protein
MKRVFDAIVFTPVTLFLLLEALQSLKWRMFADAHEHMYMAYLTQHFHFLPYKDYFEISAPGVSAIYYLFGRIFGYSDFGFRCADLLYLSTILILTASFLRAFGWRVALFASISFGLIFLSLAPHNFGMQKEYLVLLPLAAAIAVLFSEKTSLSPWRSCAVGFLFGICAATKPHTAIGLPAVAMYEWAEECSLRRSETLGLRVGLGVASRMILGFFIPLLIVLICLWAEGISSYFLDMAANFWPVYSAVSGDGTVYQGLSRVKFYLKQYFAFGGESRLMVPAVLGAYLSLFLADFDGSLRRRILLLCGLAFSYSLYVVVGG